MWVMGCGLWDVGYGMWDQTVKPPAPPSPIMSSSKIAITAVGHTDFGHTGTTCLRELAHEATAQVYDEAGCGPEAIDASVVGVASGAFAAQEAPAPMINDQVGLAGKPTQRVELACASGSAAVHTAIAWIRAGLHDTVLVVGAETMTHLGTRRATGVLSRGGDVRWEYPFGVTFPAFYALMARAHADRYGTSREMLSTVAVKAHRYGALNPRAHLRDGITLEQAGKSPPVAEPLRLYDCTTISDGAAALLLTRADRAGEFTDTPVRIEGWGCASDTMLVNERKSLTGLKATRLAARSAFDMARCEPREMDLACVHDCFTIAEIMALEDLGFCSPGQGGPFTLEGMTCHDGSIPVNPDGGLKAKGHPLGATGVSQLVELVWQLRGEAEPGRQVEGARIGLAHNVAQAGQAVNVTVVAR